MTDRSSSDSEVVALHAKSSSESFRRIMEKPEPENLRRSNSNVSKLSHIISGIKDDIEQDIGEEEAYANRKLPEEAVIDQLDLISRNSTRHESAAQSVESEEYDELEANAPPLDKGYAWVVCFACMLIVIATWGANSGYGVFLRFYINSNAFPEASQYDYALIGGLVVALAMFLAPVGAILYAVFGFKTVCITGTIIQTAAYILASFATKIWQLYLTQGVLVGVSFSLVFIPATLVLPTWFKRHKATAMGITVSGAGTGGVLYSLSLNKVIQDAGDQRWALRMAGMMSGVMALVAGFLLRPRIDNKQPLSVTLKKDFIMENLKRIYDHHIFSYWALMVLAAWFSLIMLGYVLGLFSISSYAAAVGLSPAQGSVLTAVINVGQAIGRPTIGLLGDRLGRTNIAFICSVLLAILVWAYWINATSYGALIPFSLIIGLNMGVGSTMAQPIATDIVTDPSQAVGAWSIINVIASFFCLSAEVIALALTQNSSSRPFLHTQIFAGAAFFFAALLMLQVRSHLVGQIFEHRLKVSEEKLHGLRKPKSRYLTVSDLEPKTDSEEEAVLEERIARYRHLTRRSIHNYFIRMFYPIRV